MPKPTTLYPYKDLVFLASVSKDRPRANGYYVAALRYEYHGAVLIKRYAERKDKEKLELHIQTEVLPEMYYETSMLIKESGDIGESYLRIGLFWEMFKEDIAERYHWNAKTTRALKETRLIRILPLLFDKPMRELTLEDYLYAVDIAAQEIGSTESGWKLESYVLLSRLTNTAYMRGICDDDPLDGYVQQIHSSRNPIAEIRDHFKINHLSDNQEQNVYRQICENVEKEGLFLGIALMLFAGLSTGESCALRASDLRTSTIFPEIQHVCISKVCRRKKTKDARVILTNDDLLDSANAYRLIPVHPLLAGLLEKKSEMNKASRRSIGDDFFIVTKGDNVRNQADPEDLRRLHDQIMNNVNIYGSFDVKSPNTSNNQTIRINPPSILRDNFIFQLNSLGMTENEILYLTGRKMRTTASKHYRDWASDYTQLSLYKKLLRWQWADRTISDNTNYTETEKAVISAGQTEILEEIIPNQPVTARITLRNNTAEASAKSKIKVVVSSPNGFFGKCIKTNYSSHHEESIADQDKIESASACKLTNDHECKGEYE